MQTSSYEFDVNVVGLILPSQPVLPCDLPFRFGANVRSHLHGWESYAV